MTDIVTRLRQWNPWPATADLCAAAADEISMLRRQRMALLELLADAADVIHNLPDECESQDESDQITELKNRIADARAAVMLAWNAEGNKPANVELSGGPGTPGPSARTQG